MRNYQDMVFSTAMRLLARSAEAEDISQEVFLKAYERFGELRESKTAGGWLKTVATNLSLNHLSRYRSRWSFFSELLGPGREEHDEAEIEFPASDDVEADLARSKRRELVEQALQTLPAAQRVPLVRGLSAAFFGLRGIETSRGGTTRSRARWWCACRARNVGVLLA